MEVVVKIKRKKNIEEERKIKINKAKKLVLNKLPKKLIKYLCPLYMWATINRVPEAKVLVDNGAAINAIPYRMLKKFAKSEVELIPIKLMLTNFNGGALSTKGVVPLDITIQSASRNTIFFVIDGTHC